MSLVETTASEIIHKKTYPSILLVPQTNEFTDYKSYIGALRPEFKATVKRHLDVVNAADFSSLDGKKRKEVAEIRALLNHAWNWFGPFLDDQWQSQDAINDTFAFLDDKGLAHFPQSLATECGDVDIRKMEDFFRRYLAESKGATVVVSETHATTTPLIRTLKEANPEAKIGMFVFDTHLDTDPGPHGDVPRKSNTLRLLIDGDENGKEPVVERLTVIGVPDKIEVDHRGSAWGIERYKDKIDVVREEDLYGSDPHNLTFSKKAMDEIIFAELSKMKGAGITNVLVSFDLDVLKNAVLGLTAFEYSAFHALLYLASQRDIPVYASLPGMLYSFLTNTGFAGEIDRSVIDYPVSLGGRGLSVSYARHALSAIGRISAEMDMEFGIKFENAQVLGDVVELSGPDYQNRTKEAALQIAQSMLT
ncbi:MAG: hypothetical protein ACOYUB_02655 [Patescibacteria group bacterium]